MPCIVFRCLYRLFTVLLFFLWWCLVSWEKKTDNHGVNEALEANQRLCNRVMSFFEISNPWNLDSQCELWSWKDDKIRADDAKQSWRLNGRVGLFWKILLMEEILHHLGCIKLCKWWDKPINWCRISSINSIATRDSCFQPDRELAWGAVWQCPPQRPGGDPVWSKLRWW